MDLLNLVSAVAIGLTPLLSSAYECDTGELRRVPAKEMTSVSSKKFSIEYDQAYSEQLKSIENLKTKIPVGSDPREFYLSTRLGQQDLKHLEELRTHFQYDSISQYLLDDDYFNTQKEHYSTTYKQGQKIFYLNRGRLIAIMEKKSSREYLMTRLNSRCQPFEIVSFTDLDPSVDSNIRYKITPPLCRMVSSQPNLPFEKAFETYQGFVDNPNESLTRIGVKRDCELLKKSPATPKSNAIASGR